MDEVGGAPLEYGFVPKYLGMYPLPRVASVSGSGSDSPWFFFLAIINRQLLKRETN